MVENIAVIGSSGALGYAFTRQLSSLYPQSAVHAFSRRPLQGGAENITYHPIEYGSEANIEEAAVLATKERSLDSVIVATGILHDGDIMPEKSMRELSAEKFQRLFEVNTILPALVAKHFLPKLAREKRSVFAALSARVGSISDNHLGGWYAYRASKAALNMVIKNAAIEIARRNKQAIIVGLHPGTVDSHLSKPFQANVAEGALFTPEHAVSKMIAVLDSLTPEQSGRCFAWNGQEVQP